MQSPAQPDMTQLAADVVAAYVSNNSLPSSDLGGLVVQVHSALVGLSSSAVEVSVPIEKATPAQIRKSITHDALISFLDGKPYKTLKRHLATHGMTFETYRERYGLPADYPSVSPSYSETRSALAKSFGLGSLRRGAQKAAAKAAAPSATITEKPKRASRPRKAAST